MKAFARAIAVLLACLLSHSADAVTTTVIGNWPAGQTTSLFTNINGPANSQQISFTGYVSGPYNYLPYPFKVTATGSYTASSATINVLNTTWFLNGIFVPSNPGPATPLGDFIVAVLAANTNPKVGDFTARTYTVGQQYSVVVVFNTGSTPADTSTFTMTGPGCVIIAPTNCPPGEPQAPSAVAGPAQATVTFTAPISDGGFPITGYTVVSNPAGGVDSNAGTTGTSHLITGLTNGTAYTFTVVPSNSVGAGLVSVPTNSVTPLSVSAAPTIGVVTAGNAQATVAFTPPASDGGSAITGYTATCGALSTSGPASPLIVTGLTNGTLYNCSVTATNAVGTGPASGTVSVTPMTTPGAPTIGTATGGNGRATVSFTPPASNGGSPIASYTVTCGAPTASGAGSPITVTGLANGTTVSCSVVAINAVGTGPASGTVSVTPSFQTVTGASATGSGSITASFTGGGASCMYSTPQFIAAPPGTAPVPATVPAGGITFPHGLFDFSTTGCTPGSTITMTVTYPAALPAGTTYWKYGPAPGNATPHWYTLPATITGNTATFSITDGGLGDDDLAANGTIVDQGGPGAPGTPGTAAAIPTLSQWMLILLALLVGAGGVWTRRRTT